MANKLQKVVSKSKQKPVPVKIVNDQPATAGMKTGGVDKWEAQDALRTLQRAAEIKSNKTLMRAAECEAKKQMKQLSAVCKK